MPARASIEASAQALKVAVATVTGRAAERIQAAGSLLDALSPEATLRRGFSVTRDARGLAVTSASQLLEGSEIVTTFADGAVRSVVTRNIK